MSVQIALVGLVVGTLVGLSGVGAGVLMAPTLILLGVHPSIAIGTDLAYGTVTKWVGTARNAAQGLVSRPWFIWLSVGSMPGTAAGTELTRMMPAAAAEHFLRVALAVVLLVASLAIIAKELLAVRGVPARTVDLAERHRWRIAAVGAAVGFLVGLTSIGSGSLFMLFLLTCSSLGMRAAVATDIANAAALSAVGALLHLADGTVNLSLAANLLVGSVPGILVGGRLAQYVPARPLKLGVAVLVLASGVKLVV